MWSLLLQQLEPLAKQLLGQALQAVLPALLKSISDALAKNAGSVPTGVLQIHSGYSDAQVKVACEEAVQKLLS